MKLMRSILAVAAMSAGIAAYAQNPQSWTVNIPFDFTVRHISLEPGQYTVSQSGPVVFLTSKDGKTANVLTNKEYSSTPATHSSLTFRMTDGGYDLVQVKNIGSNTELEAIVRKRAARPLESSIAPAPLTIEVAAVGTR